MLRGETELHLPPKELAALRLLTAHAGELVTPQQLRRELWGETHVTAESIPRCISSLRARLLPDQCIQTVYKRGYRFTAEVRKSGQAGFAELPRLAILPFSSGPGVARHLGHSVAEEALTRLTRLRPAVAVVLARDSVFTLFNRGLTACQIGETLHAALVLTGNLRLLPGQYRLRVEMLRVADGAQIWVEDLLVAQSRIAGLEAELVRLLTLRLGSKDETAAKAPPRFVERRKRPERREAYEIFQAARSDWQSLQRHRMQDGLQRLSRATELDPSLIPAKVDFAHACVAQAIYGFMSPEDAAGHVHRIIESIPDYAVRAETILPAVGWVAFHVEHDLASALEAFTLSEHLRHDNWTTRSRSFFTLSRGRFAEAILLIENELQRDPFSPWLHSLKAWAQHLAGQAEASLETMRYCQSQFPGHDVTLMYGSILATANGNTEEGVLLAHALVKQSPYLDLATGIHAYALARAGRADEARALLEQLQWLSRERYVLQAFTPATLVALGEPEAALMELRAAAETRSPWFFQILLDPALAPLHNRPEFKVLQEIPAGIEESAALDFGSDLLDLEEENHPV